MLICVPKQSVQNCTDLYHGVGMGTDCTFYAIVICQTKYTNATGIFEGTPCVFPFFEYHTLRYSCVVDDVWGQPAWCATEMYVNFTFCDTLCFLLLNLYCTEYFKNDQVLFFVLILGKEY